jgi:hypothetical protein
MAEAQIARALTWSRAMTLRAASIFLLCDTASGDDIRIF